MAALFVVVGVAIVVGIAVITGTRQVAQGQVAIVERLGKYHRTLKPGLNVVVPFLDMMKDVRHLNLDPRVPPNRLDMREQVLDVSEKEGAGVISKDNVVLTVDMVVFFQVTDPVKACYEIAQPVQGIVQICRTTMRSIFGGMDLDTSLSSRELVNARLRTVLDEVTDKWGIKIVRVEIQRISPPEDMIEVMKQQMTAERDRRARVTLAEGKKQSQILEAEGIRTAKILQAEGEAESIRLVQEATARGLDAVRDILGKTEGIRGLLVLETLKKQQEIAKALADGASSKFYLPTSLAGLYGAVDGIKEMLKLHDSAGGERPA